MVKAYSRIVWVNYPEITTPLNETNLNRMDQALDTIDNRVVGMDTTKAEQSELLTTLSNVTYNDQTGLFTFTWKNGNTLTVDLNIEKIPVSFSMSPQGVITMTTADGTTFTADVSELIKTYTFNNSSEISFTVVTDSSGNKTVTAGIVDGSVTAQKLQPNFLADCQAAEAGAEDSAEDAEAWAKGTRNGVPVSSDDPTYQNNSKYYSEQSIHTTFRSLTDVDFTDAANNYVPTYNSTTDKLEMKPGGGGGGTSDYNDLTNKPSINNVTLSGNKTSSDLGLVAVESGKGLSSNDYTTAEKNKLAGIAANAEVNVQSDWNQTDNTADDYIKNKPTSLGHTMVNNAGTSLQQRSKLKTVGGLNATDDGANNTTEITDVVEEVPWATWQSYPSEEAALQAHPNCVVTGAPDCDGDVEIEFEKVLWTNESPSSAFSAGQITLNSSGYTDYEIRFAPNKNSTVSQVSSRTEKGKGTLLNYSAATGSGVMTFSRSVAYVDATHLSIADCTYATGTTADVTNNDSCIPIEVIGHNRNLTAKIKAIAHDVSTSASKCMMSDGQTSAEDMVTTDGLHNVDVPTGVTVSEHFNYFKIGKLVVVILGGVIPPSSTVAITIANNLPVMRSRPLAVVSNDSNSSLTTIVFGSVGLQQLYLSNPTGGIKYYGQVVYYTD